MHHKADKVVMYSAAIILRTFRILLRFQLTVSKKYALNQPPELFRTLLVLPGKCPAILNISRTGRVA